VRQPVSLGHPEGQLPPELSAVVPRTEFVADCSIGARRVSSPSRVAGFSFRRFDWSPFFLFFLFASFCLSLSRFFSCLSQR